MTASLAEMLGGLHRLLAPPEAAQHSDAALLRRFAREQDGAAFALLVARHGPLVLGVCRRWLRRAEDVEDAFQATFLVLARRAGHVGRPERLGNWLFGVALRVARKLRGRALRQAAVGLADDVPDRRPGDCEELVPLLDEELARLPERDRLAVVLCCLEGRSREEAARELGASPGAVKGLLERGRRRLRERLERRGVSPAALSSALAPAVVPQALSRHAAEAALSFAAGALSAPAAELAQGVITEMLSLRWKFLGAALLLGAAFAGAGLALPTPCPAPPAARLAPVPEDDPEPAPRPVDLKHAAAVNAMVFTPDGGTLITASSPKRGQLLLWDARTGKERARATVTHKSPVRALAVSRQGVVASADESGRVLAWRARDGKPLWTNETEVSTLSGLSFSPDGKTLVGVANSREVRRWGAEGGRALASWFIGGSKVGMRSVAYRADGKSVLVSGLVTLNVGTHWAAFHVVDAATGKATATTGAAVLSADKLRETAGHPVPVAVAAKGDLWAGAATDNLIHLPKNVTLKGHTKAITGLAFLPDGKHLVSAGRDGTVRFWDVKKAAEVARVSDLGSVGALAVSPDGKRLAWADAKGVVKVRDVAALRAAHALKKRE